MHVFCLLSSIHSVCVRTGLDAEPIARVYGSGSYYTGRCLFLCSYVASSGRHSLQSSDAIPETDSKFPQVKTPDPSPVSKTDPYFILSLFLFQALEALETERRMFNISL